MQPKKHTKNLTGFTNDIHQCKERSFRVQQNRLCRTTQKAEWALNRHQTAAEHWPLVARGYDFQPNVWSRFGHNLGHSHLHASGKGPGGLFHTRG